MFNQNLDRGALIKRRPPRDQEKQRRPQGIKIGMKRQIAIAPGLFRRHVKRRAQHNAGHGEGVTFIIDSTAESEIDDLHRTQRTAHDIDNDVGGLDVTMDDVSSRIGVIQGGTHPADDLDRQLPTQNAVRVVIA